MGADDHLKNTGLLYLSFNFQATRLSSKYEAISQIGEILSKETEAKLALEKYSITDTIYVRESQVGQKITDAKGANIKADNPNMKTKTVNT